MEECRRRRGIPDVEKAIRVPDSSIAFSAFFFFFFALRFEKKKNQTLELSAIFEDSEIRFSKP